ncbi:MAG TPA: PKD domain-containing protein [Longimicrobium sp.]|nr:PKD domain-containing protein [Longimicrobium sp.]
MRSIHTTHRSSARVLTALAALLVLAACEREITREEARAGGASLVRARSTPAELAFGVTGMNAAGDLVGNGAGGQPYRWTRDGGQVALAHSGVAAWVNDINDGGVAVGMVQMDTNGVFRAVVWAPDGQVQLLPGDMPGAVYINDAGTVAGGVRDADGRFGAFRWLAQGGMQVSGYPGPGHDFGPATEHHSSLAGFNGAGAVLMTWEEWCYDSAPAPHFDCYNFDSNYEAGAVVWQADRWVELEGSGPGMLRAHALNDSGVAVGCDGSPVRWGADGAAQVLDTREGCAYAVNGSGVVVGTLNYRAFRWTEAGGMQDLGTLGGYSSEALAVNEAGDVVGWSYTASGVQHGFLWTAAGGMQPLAPLPGATWSTARFVNDARDVAGNSGIGRPDGYEAPWRPTRWFDVVPAHPPFAHAGGPYPTRISGRRYAYSAAASTEAPGDPARYAWDMDADGTFEGSTSAQAFSYAYPSAGTYTIRMVMTDAGEPDTATATVVVERNVAPAAAITGTPVSAAEGALVTGTAYVTDRNQAADSTELSAMRYRWEWGDGSVSTAKTSSHRYADQGSYTLRLIVTDAGGLADTVVRTLPVGNVSPTARLNSPTSIREGTPFTLTASALSDAAGDVAAGLQVAFNCGGGFGAYGTALTKVCPARPDQGSVTVGLRVRDKDGGGSATAREIPVANVAPQVTAQATSATSFAAGGSLAVRGTFTDVAGDAPWRYRIYWGDGAYTVLTPVAAGATITGSYRYARAGTYAVHITVVDKDGGFGRSAPIAVTVTP